MLGNNIFALLFTICSLCSFYDPMWPWDVWQITVVSPTSLGDELKFLFSYNETYKDERERTCKAANLEKAN